VRHPNEVLQQAILVQAYQRASCQIGDETLTAAEAHDRIDRALEFLVGKSDDLTVSEVQPVLAQALGTGGDLRLLAQVQAMQKTQAALRRLRPPRILSTVMSKREDQSTGEAVKEQTQALRLLGQRYAADSEMLGRLVYGHVTLDPGHPLFQQLHLQCESIPERKQHELCDWAVGKERSQDACRLMPTSLDVAALLGSELANGYVAPARRYCGYTEQQRQLASQWSGDASRAPDTLYLAWLQALGPLLRPASRGYPTWMRGKPYDKKALRTALASWSELRHDTILYVKQSYTSKLVRISLGRSRPRPPEAYGIVEPQPELYARLKRLSVQTRLVLGSLKLLPGAVLQSLQEVEGVFDRLISITRKQLEGKDLSRDDERYIKSFGGRLQRLLSQLTVATTPPTRYEKIEGRPEDYPQRRVVEGQEDAFKTTLVADVHSEVNSGRALEEAVGPIEWLIVINPTADGQLSVAVGPVFSYYEFTRPLSDRMTDEEWRERLKTGGAPAPRWWTHDEPIAQGLETPRL